MKVQYMSLQMGQNLWQVIAKEVKLTLNSRREPPAMTPEERENQLIALAIDAAEKQIREGKASSQIICHYLKLASSKERLEKELLEKQVELAAAKTEMIQSAKRTEELYLNALNAMRSYSGASEEDDEYE